MIYAWLTFVQWVIHGQLFCYLVWYYLYRNTRSQWNMVWVDNCECKWTFRTDENSHIEGEKPLLGCPAWANKLSLFDGDPLWGYIHWTSVRFRFEGPNVRLQTAAAIQYINTRSTLRLSQTVKILASLCETKWFKKRWK